jgi:hypothetical protein
MEMTREEKLEQLERVLQSRTLHGSESLKAFLRYVVIKALDNEESSLKEYTIATEVFGRGDKYDSRNDSVVRVQAGRLRAKLHDYYTSEGKNDRLVIDLPKGHYTPTFSHLPAPDPSIDHNGGLTAEALPESKAASTRRLIFILAGFVILLFAALSLLSYRGFKETLNSRADDSPEKKAIKTVWGDFLGTREPTLVTFSNTLFQGTAETGMKLLKPLDSSGKGIASPSMLEDTAQARPDVVTEHYTGIGEAMGVYFLGDLFYRADHSIRVKRSLLLTWDDIKSNNIVVLGSPAENFLFRDLPLEQDFVFRIVTDEKGNKSFGVVNTRPRPGEQEVYLARQEGPSRSQISEDYAVISFLRGLDPKNRILLLAGVTTFGTQAAAEYMSKPEHMEELISRLNTSPDLKSPVLPPFYQVLIKVKVNGGVPVQISYVTHHAL